MTSDNMTWNTCQKNMKTIKTAVIQSIFFIKKMVLKQNELGEIGEVIGFQLMDGQEVPVNVTNYNLHSYLYLYLYLYKQY